MSPRVELASFVLICIAAALVAIACIVLLSRLTSDRLKTLEALHAVLAAKATTYVPALLLIGNELYSSWRFEQPINITAILSALGLITVRAGVGREAQKTQEVVKENTAEVLVAATPIPRRAPPPPAPPIPPTAPAGPAPVNKDSS